LLIYEGEDIADVKEALPDPLPKEGNDVYKLLNVLLLNRRPMAWLFLTSARHLQVWFMVQNASSCAMQQMVIDCTARQEYHAVKVALGVQTLG